MKFLWTKSNKPLSVLIRKVTGEPVSHVVIATNGFVVHSNLKGVHVEDELVFRANCEVVFELSLPEDASNESKLHTLLSQDEGKLYDFGALIFVGLAMFLRTMFKIPLPKSNLWQSTGMFMCTEWVSEFLDNKEDSMITPYGLYLKLLANKNTPLK